MNLVGKNGDTVLQTDLTNTEKLFVCPDSSGRIVGIAENADRNGGIGRFLRKVFKINGIGAVCLTNQLGADKFQSGVYGSALERTIGRSEKEYFFIGLAKVLCQIIKCRDDAV